jgi:uncharacterized protein (DUF1800 family)
MRRTALVALAMAASLAAAELSKDDKIVHALNRLTFGPRPGDVERVRSMGLKKWIDLQLHPERIAESARLEDKVKPLTTLAMGSNELARMALAGRRGVPARTQARQQMRAQMVSGVRKIGLELMQAKLFGAIYSERQLEEVLVDFWYNHFNVFFDKGADRFLVTEYEREAIRPHVLGKFHDLLTATAKSPAMLFYLDNWQSMDPNALPARRGRNRRGLNENYARELLELHTLGVDGGYTQNDVTEVARCFTGWTIRQPRLGGDFAFNPRMHDRGEKVVLGVRIPAGGGMEDGLKVLEIVSKHPSTARFVSRKLAQRFVADEPPATLVNRMAAVFAKSDGDIRAVLKALFDAKEFWAQEVYRAKMKSPLELVASAVRAADADVAHGLGLINHLQQLGQPLYRKQEPTGYPNSGDEWLNSASLVARMNFAVQLAENRLAGVKIDPARVDGTALGSPEFQKR